MALGGVLGVAFGLGFAFLTPQLESLRVATEMEPYSW